MIIKKRHVLIIIGIFLMLQTYNSILRLIPYFFENGSAIIEYNITGQVEVDEIQNIIYKNTDIKKDNIIITLDKEKLLIELPYIDIGMTSELDEKISRKLSDSIEAVHVVSIGPMDLNEKSIIIFSMFCMVFILGFIIFV